MSDDPWVVCAVCCSPDFYVVFKNNGIDAPSFCPFCGEEIEYPVPEETNRD